MKKIFFAACTAAFALVLKLEAGGRIVVCERGREALYSIAIPANPSPSERYAAEELQEHIEKLVGQKLPIVSNDGCSSAKRIFVRMAKIDGNNADDAFRLRTDDVGNVYAEGGRRGVLYAVYELLETYGGIGWYASWHTHIPKADKFELQIGRAHV